MNKNLETATPDTLGVHSPILEYLESATPEPEKVWCSGLRGFTDPQGGTRLNRYSTESAAWRARERRLANGDCWAKFPAPLEQTLAKAKAVAASYAMQYVALLDEEGREVKRWPVSQGGVA